MLNSNNNDIVGDVNEANQNKGDERKWVKLESRVQGISESLTSKRVKIPNLSLAILGKKILVAVKTGQLVYYIIDSGLK